MPGLHFIPSAGFPQIGGTRTRGEIVTDLLDYVGGAERPEAQARAVRALAETVRTFNSFAWRFNRLSEDITFVADMSEYTFVDTNLRDVWKVMLLDSDGELAGDLGFMPYEDFLRYDGSTVSTAQFPDEYTLFNTHNEGKIRFIPRMDATTVSTSYPAARVFYHQRIVMPGTDADYLNVPQEVESAIVRQAAAILIARSRTFEEATRARADANEVMQAAKREWRDFPDFHQRMR
jgi:hypothetical protein